MLQSLVISSCLARSIRTARFVSDLDTAAIVYTICQANVCLPQLATARSSTRA